MTQRQTLVFLPGLLCDARLWAAQIEALQDRYDCRFVDLLACASLDEMIDAVSAAAKRPFILIGFSMGGYLAQEFMLRHGARVSKLALLAISARGTSAAEEAMSRQAVEQARKGRFLGASRGVAERFIDPGHSDHQGLVTLVGDMARAAGRDAFIRQRNATLKRRDLRLPLAKVTCPSLVLGGRQDAIVASPLVEELAACLPTAELHLLDRCGHMLPLEQPVAVTRILRNWLEA